MLYCSLITCCTSDFNIKRVLTLQKKAVRINVNEKINAHTQPIFQQLQILPFDQVLTLRKNLFMHDIMYTNLKPTFANTWTTNLNRNLPHGLRNNSDFFIVAPRFEGFKRFPFYGFAKSWNELGELKLCPIRNKFKKLLINQLLYPNL